MFIGLDYGHLWLTEKLIYVCTDGLLNIPIEEKGGFHKAPQSIDCSL